MKRAEQDGVLAEIFHRIGTESMFFVEFGVGGGREGNSVLLADVYAWGGLFIEGSDSFAELEYKYLAIDRTEEHIRVYGTVAVVTGRVSIHTQWAPAAPSTAKLLFTDVWTRQADGRWQMVAWRSTRQPEVAAAPSPRPSP